MLKIYCQGYLFIHIFNNALLTFQVLTLKRCPVSDITLSLMAENCRLLRDLTIESVEDVTTNILSDVGISEIGQSLRYLQKLDISWNLCKYCLTNPFL